jgi:hypothetical protein
MPSKTLCVIHDGATVLSWTTPEDIVVSQLTWEAFGSGAGYVTVDPEFDLTTLGGTEVLSQLIAILRSLGGSASRSLSAPVLAGQSIFFSADGAGIFNLIYSAQLI